ncbi:MAG: cistern family PEP-CTERM protein [Chakrabartia godavariana]
MLKSSHILLAGIALATVAGPAQAASFLSGAGAATTVSLDKADPFSWTNTYNGYSGNGAPATPGLSAKITFSFLGTENKSYKFSYSMQNTSTAPIDASRLTIFGFNTDPNVSSVSVGAGDLFNVIASGNQPNGLANIDVCFKDLGPANNCTGASGGLAIGALTSGSFKLNFASLPAKLMLSDFTVRFQGIDSKTLAIRGGSASGTPVTAVPEPAAWAMMLAGFGLVGLAMRRRPTMARATA